MDTQGSFKCSAALQVSLYLSITHFPAFAGSWIISNTHDSSICF